MCLNSLYFMYPTVLPASHCSLRFSYRISKSSEVGNGQTESYPASAAPGVTDCFGTFSLIQGKFKSQPVLGGFLKGCISFQLVGILFVTGCHLL